MGLWNGFYIIVPFFLWFGLVWPIVWLSLLVVLGGQMENEVALAGEREKGAFRRYVLTLVIVCYHSFAGALNC